MFSSQLLEIGKVYTREDLRSKFEITDATLDTGIFQLSGYESVWLFVTQRMTPDRTQYSNRLEGDDLEWDGQTEGRKDDLIIQHAQRGLELLVFYRAEKYEHNGAGFRYEGPFDYLSHSGTRPTHFRLRRANGARPKGTTMIDERVLRGLRQTTEKLKLEGQLLSQAELDKHYTAFRQRFGPDALRQLDGEALLNALHAHGNRDSLVYWLEFKDDDEFPGYTFGSIAGGAATKFGIWRRKEDSQWVAADGNDARELSLEEAISIARRNRDQFIKGCEALQGLPQDADDSAYKTLQEELDRVSPDVADSAWGHKYFHMMFPDKIESYHVLSFQRFYIIKLLQQPPEQDGRYLLGGRYAALAKALGLPMTCTAKALGARYGRPHRYWRVGTSDGTASRNRWEMMRDGACVAIGWSKIGDLSGLEYNRDNREKLRLLMQQHYPSTPQAVGRATQQLFRFRGAISEGDIVLAMDGGTVLGIAKTVGPYQFDASLAFSHKISVEWLSLDEWKPQRPEGLQTSVHEIKDNENRLEIEHHLLDDRTPPAKREPAPRPVQVRSLLGVPGKIQAVLERKCQVILYGPPGTGKTHWARHAACELAAMYNLGKAMDDLSAQEKESIESALPEAKAYVRMCCFHPSYSYEDFLEGYRPQLRNGNMFFELRDGIFKKLCAEATADLGHRYYLVVDEINRGDIPRIFGELMTVLERDKRGKPVLLPLTATPLVVPSNLYIIGTMNTADRSIALLDTALRRRFGFIELMPDNSALAGGSANGIPLGPWLDALNALVLQHVGRDARNLQVGHSYLMENGRPISDFARFARAVREEIIPLIQEYCYEDYLACEKILGKSLIDAERQKIRDDIFDPARQEDLVSALMAFCPNVSASQQALTAEAEETAVAAEEQDEGQDDQQQA